MLLQRWPLGKVVRSNSDKCTKSKVFSAIVQNVESVHHAEKNPAFLAEYLDKSMKLTPKAL